MEIETTIDNTACTAIVKVHKGLTGEYSAEIDAILDVNKKPARWLWARLTPEKEQEILTKAKEEARINSALNKAVDNLLKRRS